MAKMPGRLVAVVDGVDGDLVVLQRQAPVGDRAERHREAEERQQHIGLDAPGRAIERGHGDGLQLAAGAFQRRGAGRARRGRSCPPWPAPSSLASLSGAARNLSRRWITETRGGDLGQRQRPVDGGVAAAGDHHALAAETLALRDVIEDALALVGLDAGQRRPVGTEGADAGGDDHRPACTTVPLEVVTCQKPPLSASSAWTCSPR